MLDNLSKTIILSGTILSSVYIFTSSLNNINCAITQKDNYHKYVVDSIELNRILAVNSIVMLFSGATFSYFAYVAIKN